MIDSEQTVDKAIVNSGGSPRELLRILEYTAFYSDKQKGILTFAALEKAIKHLAADAARYLDEKDIAILKEIKVANQKGIPILFMEGLQDLLEKLVIFEYNQGSYKRVNPIVEQSDIYQHYVAK